MVVGSAIVDMQDLRLVGSADRRMGSFSISMQEKLSLVTISTITGSTYDRIQLGLLFGSKTGNLRGSVTA